MGRDWFRGVGLATVLAASVTAYGQGAPSKGAGAPAGAPATAAPSVAPTADPVFQEAARLYEAGVKALEQQQYSKAIEQLSAAYALRPKAQIAWKLGEAEFQAKKYRDCAEHLEKALREGREKMGPSLASVEKWFDTAKKNVATLKVTVVPPPGAAAGWDAELELLVDRKPSRVKGPLPPEVFVEEGTRILVVRVGEARDEVTGEYKKGTESSVTLTLKVPAVNVAPTATASVAPTTPVEPSNGPPRALLITGGVLTAAAAVAGGVTLGLFFVKAGDVSTLQAGLTEKGTRCSVNGVRVPGAPVECTKLDSAVADGNLLVSVSTWFLVGAGLAGLGTLGLWKLAPKSNDTGAADVRITGAVGPNAGRLMLEGSW